MNNKKLEELFSEVQDIGDPDAITNVLIYLEELQSEDEEFMEILLSQQQHMNITWEQPWYQQSNSLTRAFKSNDDDELPKFRMDTISKEENDKIHRNWKRFRKLYGLPNTPICFARWRNKDKSRNPRTAEERVRKFVTAFLAQGLERTLYQVYKHIVTYYGSPYKGAYSECEEKIMAICLYHSPKNAVPYLAYLLSREPRGIYKKLNQMYKGLPERKKLKWTLPLATKFLKLLMLYSGESLENLKNKHIDKSVWLQLEKDMDQQYIYLQRFWHSKLHVQLFVKYDVKMYKLRRKIFKKLRNYPYQVWSDIRWKEILKQFPDGFTHFFLYRTCYTHVVSYQGYLKAPLQDLIDYGLKKATTGQNRRLKTLILNKDQELEIIRYSNKKPNSE